MAKKTKRNEAPSGVVEVAEGPRTFEVPEFLRKGCRISRDAEMKDAKKGVDVVVEIDTRGCTLEDICSAIERPYVINVQNNRRAAWAKDESKRPTKGEVITIILKAREARAPVDHLAASVKLASTMSPAELAAYIELVKAAATPPSDRTPAERDA